MRVDKLNNRHNFEKITTTNELPNLLDLQVGSFHEFLQESINPKEREMFGLHEAFASIFPLQDNHENYILEYKSYTIGKARYTPRECSDRGITYSVPLTVQLRLKITDEKDKKKFAQVIDQDVYFGNIPYMTDKGTFIINGAERTVVTQLQRSPGAFFDQKFHPNGAKLYNARIIPIRGSWIDFTTDINDILFTIIDRKRKFPATMLLRSLGFSSDEDIYNAFELILDLDPSKIDLEKLSHYVVIEDIIDHETGELFVESGKELNESIISTLKKNKTKSIKVVDVRNNIDSMMIHNTIQKDPTKSTEEIRNLVGQGAGAMLGRSIWGQAKKEFGKVQDEKIKKQMVKDFVDYYGKNIVNESTLINGVKEFLVWSKENEISMAVCTNKQEHLAIDLLKKIGIYHFFEYVAGHNTFDYCKPDPRHLTTVIEILDGDINKSLMIGDSETDANAAKEAGIPVILLEDGYTEKNTTEIYHNHLVKDFIGIEKIVTKYL